MDGKIHDKVQRVIEQGKKMQELSLKYDRVCYFKEKLKSKDKAIDRVFSALSIIKDNTGIEGEKFIEELRGPMIKMCDRIEEDLLKQISEM